MEALPLIPLTLGLSALVDDADMGLLEAYTWHATPASSARGLYYAKTDLPRSATGRRQCLYMHRLLCPGAKTVDHINRNGLDNRRSNLRHASQKEQTRNSGPRGGSSRFKGVSWYKATQKWSVQITVDYKSIFLGYFADEVAAANAYDEAASKFFGEFAYLNGAGDGRTSSS